MSDINYYNKNGYLDPLGDYVRVSAVLDIRNKPELVEHKLRVVAQGGLEALQAEKDFYCDRGHDIHDAIETFLRYGDEVTLPTAYEYNEKQYNFQHLFDGFKRWHEKTQPVNCIMELFVYSDEHIYAGRCDLICHIDGETWIVDYKTSGKFHEDMELQLAAYRQAYFEMTGVYARTGILRLTESTQKGWQFKELDGDFRIFKNELELRKWAESKKKKPTKAVEEATNEQIIEVAL